MHIRDRNFRGVDELTLGIGNHCIFIDENNFGKSTILDALKIWLTSSFTLNSQIVDQYDCHLTNETLNPTKSPPIEITLTY